MASSVEKLDAARSASARALTKRILSAIVLMPLVIAAVHVGGALFEAMVAFASIVMLFEWTRMVERRAFSPAFYTLVAGAAGAMYFAASGGFTAALAIAAAGGLGAAWLAKRDTGIGVWSALAALYIVIPCIALIWLRLAAPEGRAMTFVLYAVVWAADTGAFFFGKFIGGPKISYALSPSKTWAGIGGGVLGGGLIGAVAGGYFFGAGAIVFYLLIGGALGAASVLGDLAESAFKRNFGLKDVSGFIPGHGGALDRLDGMIFATSAMTAGLLVYMMAENIQG